MKKIILAIALISTSTVLQAAPFLVSDPLTAGVTQCGVLLDAASKVTIPVTAGTGGNVCKFDLTAVTSGSHTVRLTAITANDPIWGSQESAPSAPLAFTRPATPASPAGLALQP